MVLLLNQFLYIYKNNTSGIILNSADYHGKDWDFNDDHYSFQGEVQFTGKAGEWWVADDGKTIVVVQGPDECDGQKYRQETDKTEGDPVNPGLGGLIFSIEDLNIPTFGVSVKFKRTYKNIFPFDGAHLFEQFCITDLVQPLKMNVLN